jgi:hypothetical protein
LDDRSRAFMGYRWSTSEDAVRAAAALRAGIGARGVPEAIYLDYADVRVMPTSARKPLPQAVIAPSRSA